MPYADREQKLKAMKRWREEVMPKGYGKWLYARRKLRFEDADRFRECLLAILATPTKDGEEMQRLAEEAIDASIQAENELGRFFQTSRS